MKRIVVGAVIAGISMAGIGVGGAVAAGDAHAGFYNCKVVGKTWDGRPIKECRWK